MENNNDIISFLDFKKINLQIGKITNVENLKGYNNF